jgi:hypothetical protein
MSESQARRAARKAGFVARKSRWRKDSIDNQGGFQLIDPSTNGIVDGSRFDMSADDVVKFCRDEEESR